MCYPLDGLVFRLHSPSGVNEKDVIGALCDCIYDEKHLGLK